MWQSCGLILCSLSHWSSPFGVWLSPTTWPGPRTVSIIPAQRGFKYPEPNSGVDFIARPDWPCLLPVLLQQDAMSSEFAVWEEDSDCDLGDTPVWLGSQLYSLHSQRASSLMEPTQPLPSRCSQVSSSLTQFLKTTARWHNREGRWTVFGAKGPADKSQL